MLLLAGPDRVASALARAGVGDGTTVVVYDDTQNLFASRVWWSLRAYGFESVRLLDGGFPAWVAEGRAGRRMPEHRAPPTTFTPRGPARDAPHHGGRPRPAGLPGRAAPRRPRAGRIPRATRATPSDSDTSRVR